MKACRGSHKQEFQKLWRWRCSKAWPHLPNEVLRQAKVCLPVVTRLWPFLKHYMVYVKIRFKLRNLSVPSSSPPFVFSQTYSYSHDVHLSFHIKIIAKCVGEEEEQLLQVIFWKTPYMIVTREVFKLVTSWSELVYTDPLTCRTMLRSADQRSKCSTFRNQDKFHLFLFQAYHVPLANHRL